MAVERFKKVRDAVADKVGGAADALNERVRGEDRDADGSTGSDGSVRSESAAGAPAAQPPQPDPATIEARAAMAAAGFPGMEPPPVRPPGVSVRKHLKANKDWYRQRHEEFQAQNAPLPVPPPIRDPAQRQAVAEEARASRDARRSPYRSAQAWPVIIERVVVSSDDQLGGVCAALAATGLATRPDLVYGVSRVPDRLGGDVLVSERRTVVEWAVVHACTEPTTPIAAPPEVVWFDATEPWVARAAGEPSVLDEDLALAYLTNAGIPPEQTLGIARFVTTDLHNEGRDSQSVRGVVRGVSVLHRSQTARSATEQFQSLRWMLLASGPPDGVHIEVLSWTAIASSVHRNLRQLPEIPSPGARLPSTPDELITAYLEIVGLWPGDCFSVQATRDEPTVMAGFPEGAPVITNGRGPKLACADGVDRRRLHGTTQVVVAYRDRPAYVEGRQRWAAYQDEVLHKDLVGAAVVRRPVQDGLHPDVPTFLKGAARVARQVGKVADWDSVLDPHERAEFAPHRYCWPPTTGA